MRILNSCFYTFLFLLISANVHARNKGTENILLSLQKLNTLGSVLYIAAHPDDENTRLLSYYANEKNFRTTYLSLTRGDGGQNLIGTEQGDLLGVIRTHELLAARDIDGAEQIFSRAIDFGYSKNPEETFAIWNTDSILYDVVWAIRKYRPDIIILRFPTTGEGGHGHHTASAILGLEAFQLAANPGIFSDQLKYADVWQAKRVFWNVFRPKAEDTTGRADVIPVDIGKFNAVIGKSYGEIASESRSMHKSQGFGAARNRGKQNDFLKLLDGDSFEGNEFSGIETTWDRVQGSQRIKNKISLLINEFNPLNPSAIVPGLLEIRKWILTDLTDEYWKAQKLKETEELIIACSGFFLEAIAENFSVVPGDSLSIKLSAIHRSDLTYTFLNASIENTLPKKNINSLLEKNILHNTTLKIKVSESQAYTTPYWLENRSNTGLFYNPEIPMTGVAESTTNLQVKFQIMINTDTITLYRPVAYKWVDPVRGELYRSLEVLPSVSIHPVDDVSVFVSGKSKEVYFTLRANASAQEGSFRLKMPRGWKSNPEYHSFLIQNKNEEQKFSFHLTPPAEYMVADLKAEVNIKDKKFGKSVHRIDHHHIPVQTIIRNADVKLVHADLDTAPLRVGYIEGAGDNIPLCLRQIGFKVTMLDDEILSRGNLNDFDVIITGIRLYNTNERINVYQPRLMKFVESGGTLLVQYVTNNFISNIKAEIGPYPFKITRERVTDENAEVRIINPDHKLMSQPNRITASDFKGWVQERGLYFAGDYEENYETLLSMNDPESDPLEGSLIYTSYGKGHFIYTGLSFFRELPAGVLGAYRLFVNLMAAGRPVHD